MGHVVVMISVPLFAVGSLIAAGEPKEVDVLVVGGYNLGFDDCPSATWRKLRCENFAI